MNLLKKLTDNPQEVKTGPDPDNTLLRQLLNTWAQEQTEQTYRAVLQELMQGNGYLLLPSVNEEKRSTGWETTSTDTDLQLLSVFNINGLKVLGAFSDEDCMVKWAKKVTDYTAMPARDLLEFCVINSIDRVVINNGEPNMFVIERSRQPVQ